MGAAGVPTQGHVKPTVPPANAVAGPAPGTGVVPLAQQRGKAPQATQGVFQNLPSACIFHASQNLRSGVSAMRWCSTRKSLASISRSSVR